MRQVKKIICELCGQEISKSNYSKHLRRHKNHPETFNIYKVDHEGTTCKFCDKKLPTRIGLIAHESCCKLNPNRKLTAYEIHGTLCKGEQHKSWNRGLTKETDERVRKNAETLKLRYASGELKGSFTGRHHTEETKMKLRKIAIDNKLGGHPYKKTFIYKDVVLDSSLELAMAIKLDELNINWKRCDRFPYKDLTGKEHTYTPDFYLIDYDIYLDTKNDYLINNVNPALGYKDSDKIDWVCKQNGIKVFIIAENEIQTFNIAHYLPPSSNG